MEKEHETEMPHCWCRPRTVVVRDNTITIHRCPDCNETECKCYLNIMEKLRQDVKERLFVVIPRLNITEEEFELIVQPMEDALRAAPKEKETTNPET